MLPDRDANKEQREAKMRRFLFIKAILAGLIFIIGAGASADQTEHIDRMKFGGHILMIRHALAPGSGDPPNFKKIMG